MEKPKLNLEFGIKNCADCENNIRCEECAYNKKLLKKLPKKSAKKQLKKF